MNIKYDPAPGMWVSDAFREASDLAKTKGVPVDVKFNDTEITTYPGVDHGFYVEMYNRICEERAAIYRTSPEGIAAERRRIEADRRAAEAVTEGVLPFTVANQDAWGKWVGSNTDGYSACIIRYAARWANLMEKRIGGRADIDFNAFAKQLSHEADVEGITGFMYGAAVAVLSECWVWGEQLRRWHNLDTQLGDEGERANDSGGVLNPALLNIA